MLAAGRARAGGVGVGAGQVALLAERVVREECCRRIQDLDQQVH